MLLQEARAHRDAREWDLALARFREGEERFPRQAAFTYGYVMTLADAGKPDDSIRLARGLVADKAGDADRHLVLEYAYERNRQPYAALEQASQAYDLAPERAYVARAYILAQQRAGLPQAALRTAQIHPGTLEAPQIRALQADIAAQLTRAAATESRGEANRFTLADQALAMYDQLLSQWQPLGPSAQADVDRIRADRLQALHARHRMQDVIADYENMRAHGVAVPDYVLGDVGAAYLSMRQPEQAEPLLRRALATANGHDDASRLSDTTTLFYALTESGQGQVARQELDAAADTLPTWLYDKGDPQRQPNPLKLDAAQTQALSALDEGDTLKSQTLLDEMVDAAPDNPSIRTARSVVYRARDLPREAERDLKIAESQSPRSIDVEVNQAETALALQEWHQARLLRDDLMSRAPEDAAVQRLAREWAVHNMAEWQVTAGRGVTTNSPVLGSQDWSVDTTLYSPPLAENWRIFTGTGHSEAKFAEGTGHYQWTKAGVQWRGRDITAQAEASDNRYGHGAKTGAAASIFVTPTDHWQIGAGAAFLSRDTPLRALQHDITANSLEASLRWRGDERRELTLSVRSSFFSDGNNRLEAALNGRQRLYTASRLKVDALLNLSASRNTAAEGTAQYFNPKSDLTVLPALQLTHTLHERYERRWEQQFLIGAGSYTQQHFGTGGVVTVGYGQRYHYSDTLEFGFMVTGTSRPYDGQRERDYQFLINMTYRF
ncbi:MAG TPA: poly-beta-1,6 N-acetyl-D-glucosamine export porin PgaA [Castellaniella sp.]|uniref:poly-beta-1,6 N-acetyl-D-glucosamine export porin PgaA n=1 Tax=Castellaniella sp. TaxID=1955812 RepID=UPI002F16EC74